MLFAIDNCSYKIHFYYPFSFKKYLTRHQIFMIFFQSSAFGGTNTTMLFQIECHSMKLVQSLIFIWERFEKCKMTSLKTLIKIRVLLLIWCYPIVKIKYKNY